MTQAGHNAGGRARAEPLFEWMVEVRRRLHRTPELAFEEAVTAGVLTAELERLGIGFRYDGVGSGVIGRIPGRDPQAPRIALRAEMDALPGGENTDLPFASTVAGKVHADRFAIAVRGRGGHGARPHETVDAVVVSGLLVTAIQTLVSREVNPVHPSVVTVGTVHAGSAPNVIAEEAALEGTIRTTDPRVRAQLHAGLRRMCQAVGMLHDAEVSVRIDEGYPPVVNTHTETRIAYRAARTVVGDRGLVAMDHPSMGSEDFSYYLEQIPGCFVRFGARAQGEDYIPLHSPEFDIDERVLPVGAAFFDEVAREAMRSS